MNICINETKLSLEVDPHLWSIEFQQWFQGSSTGEKQAFQQMIVRQLDIQLRKNKQNLCSNITPYIKINSVQNIDLTIKPNPWNTYE